jgi:DNA-binding transcriptional LysR family regulator
MSLSSLYLDAFFACAQSGHFTKAASDLFITQSALSQRIAKLEAELGTSLFVRQTTGIKLTPAGEELLRYCKTREALEQSSLSKIKGTDKDQLSGVIRIGGFSSIMRSVILPSLAPLLKKYPQLKFQMISKEMNELPVLLRRGEIDYMIHYHELIRDEIETVSLGNEKNVLVEKANYDGPNVFLDHDENDQTTAKYLKLIKSKESYDRRYLDDVYGLIDGVKNGIGRALLPEHLIKGEKGLHIADKKHPLYFPVILHYFRQPYYPELHKQVVSHLADGCQKYLG